MEERPHSPISWPFIAEKLDCVCFLIIRGKANGSAGTASEAGSVQSSFLVIATPDSSVR